MTRVEVHVGAPEADPMPYRAVAGGEQARGRTAGEALDALAARLATQEGETIVIIRGLTPDRFFTANQRSRLEELLAARRAAGSGGHAWTEASQIELEQLVDAELRASAERAESLAHELGR